VRRGRVFRLEVARELFEQAISIGLVSVAFTTTGFPKQLWVVDGADRVFELMYGGSVDGRYHGYPVRRSDPLYDEVRAAWRKRR
jgi:hypothetical protein